MKQSVLPHLFPDLDPSVWLGKKLLNVTTYGTGKGAPSDRQD